MRILFLLSLLIFTTLHADFIEDYIQKEIVIERAVNLNENNATEMEERLIEADDNFLLFFLEYVTKTKENTMDSFNPYRSELFKLRRRVQTNKHLGNHGAVQRDELKIASILIKQNMRETMQKVVGIASKNSYPVFEKKLEEIIIDRYNKITDLDLAPYNKIREKEEQTLSVISKSILNNLREYIALQDLHNDLSAALFGSSHRLYKTVVLSSYGVLSLTIKIEDSAFAKAIAPYLEPLYLNSSKLLYIIIVIVMIFIFRFIISIIVQKIYGLITGTDDDAAYVLEKTGNPFTMLLTIIGAELVFMIYSGLSEVEWAFMMFNITYVLIGAFIIYRFGNAIAIVKMEQIDKSKHVRNEVVNLGLKMMNIVLGLIALIWVLKILGVNLTALLSGLGIGGVAVAFAAKDTIANFFGSVSILLSDLFEQGDWIAIDNMEGHVVEIGLRATTIRTFDNALIAIPNFKLADTGIRNWSRRIMGRRIKMIVGVTYESDMDDIKQAIAEIKEMIQEHPHLMSEKTEFMNNERQLKLVSKEDLKGIKRTVMVNLDNFSSSSIDIMIYCFSRSVIWGEWYEVKEDVMFKVAEILKHNHLEFAYPTMLIHRAKEVQDDLQGRDIDSE